MRHTYSALLSHTSFMTLLSCSHLPLRHNPLSTLRHKQGTYRYVSIAACTVHAVSQSGCTRVPCWPTSEPVPKSHTNCCNHTSGMAPSPGQYMPAHPALQPPAAHLLQVCSGAHVTRLLKQHDITPLRTPTTISPHTPIAGTCCCCLLAVRLKRLLREAHVTPHDRVVVSFLQAAQLSLQIASNESCLPPLDGLVAEEIEEDDVCEAVLALTTQYLV
mmetsp:Transcript_37102/g.82541  ORF Transcript_37102/g.82541 Transcript_37102/m.82541 type:complete len:217 (+) Transcript_37102:56-706(+)